MKLSFNLYVGDNSLLVTPKAVNNNAALDRILKAVNIIMQVQLEGIPTSEKKFRSAGKDRIRTKYIS